MRFVAAVLNLVLATSALLSPGVAVAVMARFGLVVLAGTLIGIHVVDCGNSHQSVVPYPLLSVFLFALDHANKPGFDRASRKSRFIHQDQHILSITVRSQCLRKESEIVRKNHSRRKDRLKGKNALTWIECEFVSASGRRFDELTWNEAASREPHTPNPILELAHSAQVDVLNWSE